MTNWRKIKFLTKTKAAVGATPMSWWRNLGGVLHSRTRTRINPTNQQTGCFNVEA